MSFVSFLTSFLGLLSGRTAFLEMPHCLMVKAEDIFEKESEYLRHVCILSEEGLVLNELRDAFSDLFVRIKNGIKCS
jgi:hypothetical protein